MALDTNVVSLQKRPRMRVFRSLMMKRRNPDGEYESEWQTIPSHYVKKWGTSQWGVNSDIKVNHFIYGGVTLELSNQDGFFNDTDDTASFFFGKLSIYRTLVRIDAGYLDDDGTKYPNESIYRGIIGEGLKRTDHGTLKLPTDHITKIFKEFPADQVTGLDLSLTASEIIDKVKNHVDTNAVAIFQKYISTWNVQTTTLYYDIATSTSLQSKSVWDLMKRLAEAENKMVFVNSGGELVFQDIATTSTAVFHFSGPNDSNVTYGKSILSTMRVDENIKNVYNRVRVKHSKGDTTTSYFIKNESWTWGDSSSSFKYGVNEYKYDNDWLTTASAQTIANNIYNKYSIPVTKVGFQAKLLPGLEIKDRVTVTHRNGVQIIGSVYGVGVYGQALYGKYNVGAINYDNKAFLVNHIAHNVENFITTVTLEETI